MPASKVTEAHIAQPPCGWSCYMSKGDDTSNDATAEQYAACVEKNSPGKHDAALKEAKDCFSAGPLCLGGVERFGLEECKAAPPPPAKEANVTGAAFGAMIGALIFGGVSSVAHGGRIVGTIAATTGGLLGMWIGSKT